MPLLIAYTLKNSLKMKTMARKNNLGFWQTEFEFPWELKKNK